MEPIRTVKMSAEAEYTEKKSVFIAHVRNVTTEDEARDFIKEIKKEYSDARHNVSAYSLRGGIMHSSDDGEPSGTGGVPVLEVMKKQGIVDAAIVVTRYFGGILLGAGGLVRAYSTAAKMAVDAAGIAEMIPVSDCVLRCRYSEHNDVLYRLGTAGVSDAVSRFDADVTVTFSCPSSNVEKIKEMIAARFDGRIEINVVCEHLGTA